MYRVSIDREACDGIFACLVRDDRFEEDADGLATLAGETRREDGHVVAEFEDDIETAQEAAAACPPNAITVTKLDADDCMEVDECR